MKGRHDFNEVGINLDGDYVLYWLQSAMRTRMNAALNMALELAKALGKPLKVVYYLNPAAPELNERRLSFLLGGLAEFFAGARELGADCELGCDGDLTRLKQDCQRASVVISDYQYEATLRTRERQLAQATPCQWSSIETNVIVPIKLAYPKQAYSAGVFRPKITQQLVDFFQPIPPPSPLAKRPGTMTGAQWLDVEYVCDHYPINRTVKAVATPAGQSAAQARLQVFIHEQLATYGDLASDLDEAAGSQLSAYLHFGQISPLDIALQVQASPVAQDRIDAYLEQLIIRREVAMNFVYYCPNYRELKAAIPAWAWTSLQAHRDDVRPVTYSVEQLASGLTHDPIWNHAQTQLVATGRMPNYIRMYWGKKIIEWSQTPEQAWATLIDFNDTYALDSCDPNGYAGIAWCFGNHDRAWKERAIFGKIRYMNEHGVLKRQHAQQQRGIRLNEGEER